VPKQNRVDPFGQLHAVEARGAWMGNRGILHDETGQIVAQWRLKRWLTCTLSFKDRHRRVFTPHSYSELFFLDEATAFSAGHRPCAECRRTRYKGFRTAWALANSDLCGCNPIRADDIDRQLHGERVLRRIGKQSYESSLNALPSGTFIERGGVAHLLWHGDLYPWTFSGYEAAVENVSMSAIFRVLTPPSIVATFKQGFVTQVHESVHREQKDCGGPRLYLGP
jgi:hypothetical protein